jgi:carbon monoxide dehydrogenase subunit G
MIETEQSLTINVDIDGVWDYAHDIRRWANLMPGLQSCDLIDADTSRWTLKVGAGGMVRTVKVAVRVLEWAGPERVEFAYKLENDPVEGGGTYIAKRNGANATDVMLKVRVEGGGPMAPMWEAMGRPLLPSLAKGFAEQLKAEIEKAASVAPGPRAKPSLLSKLSALLHDIWRAIFKPAAS